MRFVLFLLLVLGACRGDESVAAYGAAGEVWRLIEIDGAPVSNPNVTLEFPEEGRLSGQGPCNSYSGQQSAPYPWFKAESILSTKRACPDLALESAYFEALAAMQISEVSGRVLILTNEDERSLVFEAD